MDKNIVLHNVSKRKELKRLRDYIRDLFRDMDLLYTETAPNGNISDRRGRVALYNNSGNYTIWINTDGSTTWEQVSFQADGSAASTGTGTIKMASASNANSAGFLAFKKADGTTVYIPYFSDESP